MHSSGSLRSHRLRHAPRHAGSKAPCSLRFAPVAERPYPTPSAHPFRGRFFTERGTESSFPRMRESSNLAFDGIPHLDARLRGHDGPEKPSVQKTHENRRGREKPTLVSSAHPPPCLPSFVCSHREKRTLPFCSEFETSVHREKQF